MTSRGTALARGAGMPPDSNTQSIPPAARALVESIREGLVGRDAVMPGPYGWRRIVYADYTASGRAVAFVEDYIQRQVLPFYANTHTEASSTGRQTTFLREEARRVVHRAVGGGPDDVVVFCGSGSTAAIEKLVCALNIRIPANLDARHGLSARIAEKDRPVVFIGPYEHHSNELAWRESIATVVRIGEGARGRVDLAALESALIHHAWRPLKIGSFSAASNVTGICSDVHRTTELLHRHGALSFWDYAAAGAHLPIDMNPTYPALPEGALAKDAVFLSPHKFIGGPGSPGVLVAKRGLFQNRIPTVPGGGTISYVNSRVHHFTSDITAREEGGTPAIVGSIRAALAMKLKEAVGYATIRTIEDGYLRRAIASFRTNPNLVLLGDLRAARVPIVSFLVRHGESFLHHNFVVTLLSDLFGIQARGGCSCAGPYGHDLLGIGADAELGFEREVLRGRLGIKPGWARLGFSFITSEAEFDYIVAAVHFIAEHAVEFLRDYAFSPESGEWVHRSGHAEPVTSLADIQYSDGGMSYPEWEAARPESALAGYLREAAVFAQFRARRENTSVPTLPKSFEEFRWFPLPGEHGMPPRAAAVSPLA